MRDVRAAVGLQIQPDNLDDANGLDSRRQQVHLRANQVRNGERLIARQKAHAHGVVLRQFLVDPPLDLARHLGLEAL